MSQVSVINYPNEVFPPTKLSAEQSFSSLPMSKKLKSDKQKSTYGVTEFRQAQTMKPVSSILESPFMLASAHTQSNSAQMQMMRVVKN
jgi:hypothetical protein